MDHERDADDPTQSESGELGVAPSLPPDEGGDDERFEEGAVPEFLDDPDADADPAVADDATERLRELVVYLAANLTDAPDAVEVLVERRGQSVHLNLRVPEEELGKVIGRQGRIARAMRTALSIAGSRQNLRATLDIDS